MPKLDTKIVVSVMAGIAAFGIVIYVINRLPAGNVITDTAKKAVEVVNP